MFSETSELNAVLRYTIKEPETYVFFWGDWRRDGETQWTAGSDGANHILVGFWGRSKSIIMQQWLTWTLQVRACDAYKSS